jgi:replicative DNA helicase
MKSPPPHNLDAERATLGAMLLNPEAVGRAIEVLGPSGAEVFYHEPHQHIYDAFVAMAGSDRRMDVVTLTGELHQQGTMERAGGASYLASLTRAVPTSANVAHYAGIVRDMATLRAVISTSAQFSAQAHGGQVDAKELIAQAVANLSRLADRYSPVTVQDLHSVHQEVVEEAEAIIAEDRHYMGLETGVAPLDAILGGMQASDYIVIAARPSVGKTALMLQICMHVASKGIPVLVFSLEMSAKSLSMRIMQRTAGVDTSRLRSGFLIREELPKMRNGAQQAIDVPLHICDKPGINILDMQTQARRMAQRYKGKHGLIAVDYLQLMSPIDRKVPRQEQVAEISRGIKAVARETGWTVICLSQFNREADEGSEPKLSQLRESGAIEQDCDVALLLHREGRQAEYDELKLNVAKHRNGPTGSFLLHFRRKSQCFYEIARGQVEPPIPAPRQTYVSSSIRTVEHDYDEDDMPF